MRRLLFLGTGHGMPIASSCSSILVEDDENNLLLDAGGGHDLLVNFNKAKYKPTMIRNIFITHYDSDHILGIIPLVRAFHRWAPPQRRNIFCSPEVKRAIDSLFQYVAKKHYIPVKEYLNFRVIKNNEVHNISGWEITFFDVKSDKSPQMGCRIKFPDGVKLAFLGDEPLRNHYLDIVKDCDVLIHNAFCLHQQQGLFRPHEKNHSTVREAAINATKINTKKLVLFHLEDKTLKTRKKEYLKEAQAHFSGDIFVPQDLDSWAF